MGPFLPVVGAPSRPAAAPRPAEAAAAGSPPLAPKPPFAVVAPGPDTASPPAWKQSKGKSSFGRTLRLLLVACVVVGAGLGVYAYTQRSDDGDLPVIEMQATDPGSRLPGQQAIDDARAVTAQIDGVVTTDGRAAFSTAQAPLANGDLQAFAEPGMTVTSYTVQGPDYVMVLVMHSPTSLMATPQALADSMATGAAGNAGVTITASTELPVKAGKAFAYQLAGQGATVHMRVLLADDTAIAVFGFTDDGSEPVDVGAIWNSITFDGVAIA